MLGKREGILKIVSTSKRINSAENSSSKECLVFFNYIVIFILIVSTIVVLVYNGTILLRCLRNI